MTRRVLGLLGAVLPILVGCGGHRPARERERRADLELDASGNAEIDGPTASPDGKSVALCLKVKPGEQSRFMRLAVLDLATNDLTFYDDPPGLGPEMWYGASWSPDSKSVVFTFVEGERTGPASFNVWVLKRGDGTMARLLRLESGLCQRPLFSPDGSFVLARDAATHDLVTVDLLGDTHSCLLGVGAVQADERRGVYRLGYDWSADGGEVLFSRGYMGVGEPGVWSVSVREGNAETMLSDAHEPYALRCSPSGERLALVDQGDDTHTIRVASLPSFEVDTVSDKATELHVSWSKRNDRLAFCEEGAIAIWSAADKAAIRIPVPEGQPSFLSWVGSKDALVFVRDRDERWLLDVATRKQRRLVTASDALKAQRRTPPGASRAGQ